MRKNSEFLCPIHLSKNHADLTLCLLVFSADSICKQFGPRSGLTLCWA